jgi:arylsulfatase A
MMLSRFLQSVSVVSAGLLTAAAPSSFAQAPVSERPNILMILADDLGYGDLGCYNPSSRIATPNLDRLASEGMRFTQAYCPDAVCTPSRYALLTGQYAFRRRAKAGVLGNFESPLITPQQQTLPSLLKDAGYDTVGLGKWHLGATYGTTDGRPPVGQGGFGDKGYASNVDLRAPVAEGPTTRGFDVWFGVLTASEKLVVDQDRIVGRLNSTTEPPAAPSIHELPVLELEAFLPELTRRATALLAKRGKEKTDRPLFLYFAPHAPHVPLAVLPEYRGKTRAGDYGDYVHELDDHVGRVLAALDASGLADNTIVIFASDNGSQFETSGERHRPNGVLRGTKKQVYEGGVRTPLIIRWPGRVRAGATSDQLACLADVLATCAQITGRELDRRQATDSYSLLPALLGTSPQGPTRGSVINRGVNGDLAIRQGDWKYIRRAEKRPAELYNLKADPGEEKNQADNEPAQMAALAKALDEALARAPAPGRR